MSNENNNVKKTDDSLHAEHSNMPREDSTPPDETLEYVPFSDEMEENSAQTSAKKEQIEPTENQVRIQLLEEQLDRTKDQMIRALADAENSRKRAHKEREDASRFAISGFARDLLSVADNLRRALEALPNDMLNELPQIKNLADGIEATERELLRCFEKNGIVKTEPLDEKFDPNFHEVMFEAPMPDKKSGTIIQVIEPGYVISDRILRPARVGVSKGVENPSSPPDSGHSIDTEV